MQLQHRFAKCLLATAVLAMCGAAHAGLNGQSFDGYYALPDPSNEYAGSVSAPPSFTVGAGLETTITIEGVTSFAVDFSDASLDVVFATSLTDPVLGAQPFSGLVFNLLSPGPLGITSAQVGAGTTLAGFDASRIGITDGRITLDFNGLSYQDGSQVSIDFASVSAVPEPSSYVLLFAGLAAVGAVAARRKARG
ncbi:MAG: hypothetical protein JWP52_2376 [Rhizobacter sp.]|nr:hypothetical protein [Rhizobacter sp.]